MALARSDSGTVFNTGSSVATLDLTTLTVGSGSSLLIAFVHLTVIPATLTVTWDSGGTNQVMTQVGTINNTTVSVAAFRLINPTTGLKTLHAVSSNSGIVLLGAVAYSGSDVVTGVNLSSVVTNTGTGTALVLAVTGAASSVTAAAATAGANIQSTVPGAVYRSAARSLTIAGGAATHQATAASSAAWCMLGFEVLAAPVLPSSGGGRHQHLGGVRSMGIMDGPTVSLNGSMGVG